MTENNFGKLGATFQQNLIKILIEDKKFGETLIEVIEPNYFDNSSFKFLIQNIKEFNTNYKGIPNYDELKSKIIKENTSENTVRVNVDTLNMIKDLEIIGTNIAYIQETALNFCKQQVLVRELRKVEKIIENGAFEDYHKIEDMIQKALQVGVSGNEAESVFDNIEDVLAVDSRHAIATGINGIDNLLNGGIGKGELGIVLAPTGTGKTTLLTKFSNTAFNLGYNVLQIFFEDNPINIKKKHYTIWTGISAIDQPDNYDFIKKEVEDAQAKSKGNLKMLKLPSDSITISEIKSKIRKMISNGFQIDLLTLDYVDCVSSNNAISGEEWKGEASVMRSLEAMATEFNMGIWTATQGSRSSISSEVVTTDQMGGSIKKAQIGHIVLSIGKTLEQKEHNLATLTLLKSRVGSDGVVFNNCSFNNEYLTIDTDKQNTLLGHEENKEVVRKERVLNALTNREKLLQNK